MCQYSAYAEWTRDARQGEDLVVTNAPHAGSHWLTEPGKPQIAVCIPNQAPLAVQVAGSTEVRGANFEHQGWVDYLRFIDRDRERVALNDIPCGSKARVLALAARAPRAPVVRAAEPATIEERELVSAGPLASGGGIRRRPGIFTRFFD